MDESLRRYLEWRFRVNNRNQYQHYCEEWIKNVIPTQMQYFQKEMTNLINAGIYK